MITLQALKRREGARDQLSERYRVVPRQTTSFRSAYPAMAGFTLLEVMVALSVLAVGIVTVLELFGGSLRLTGKASRRTQAVIYAQSVMEQLISQEQLEDGEERGEFPDGFVWIAHVQEIHPDDEQDRLQPNRQGTTDIFHIKEIVVGVYWSEGQGEQAFMLRSLRTISDQQQPQGP